MGTWLGRPYLIRRAWLGYAVLGLIAILIYFTWTEGLAESVLYDALALSSAVAILVGVRMHGPDHPVAWYLMAAGAFAFVSGDTIYSYYIFVEHIDVPWPSLAEPIYLIGYGFFVAGLLKFVRINRTADKAALIDVSIVATSLGTVLWLFLVKPYAVDDTLSMWERVWSMAYPLMDFAILAVMARLLLSSARRSVSFTFLSASFLLLLAGDIVYGIQSLTSTYVGGLTTDGLWLLSYVLLGTSALHPSMVKLTQPQVQGARPSDNRLVLIGAAFLLVPLNLALQRALGHEIDIWVLTLSAIVLISLALARMRGLLRSESKQVLLLEEKERVLRNLLDEKAVLTDQLRHRAFHDPLTGLPNRKLFMDRVEHALQRRLDDGMVVCVIFIDIDDFKTVNDGAGHAFGDETLRAVGERLQGAMRPEDTICRLGGDEFTILIEFIKGSDVEAAAARVAAQFDRPLEVDDDPLMVAVSMGVATGDGRTTTAVDLLHNADLAMYRAKMAGKGGYEVHEEGKVDRLTLERVIRGALPGALQQGDITLHYQPIFNIASREMAGVEALARWTHPQLGFVPPLDFISVAEKSDLVVDIDLYVLGNSLQQVAEWERKLGTGQRLKVAVNVSSRSLMHADFLERAARCLSDSGVSGDRIVLEITETAMMVADEPLVHRLLSLKSLGVHLALDDFGTGYSSLARLRDLPIDILKIDRSFTHLLPAPHAIELLSFVISMARRFGMTTVAEGIEKEGELAALEGLGCDLGQGYLLARPGPPDALEHLMSEPRMIYLRDPSEAAKGPIRRG